MILVFAFGHSTATGQNAQILQFGFMSQGTSGGGPPPPPASTGDFTVSGRDVSVFLPEFFVDVVYTDAPVAKRTN